MAPAAWGRAGAPSYILRFLRAWRGAFNHRWMSRCNRNVAGLGSVSPNILRIASQNAALLAPSHVMLFPP